MAKFIKKQKKVTHGNEIIKKDLRTMFFSESTLRKIDNNHPNPNYEKKLNEILNKKSQLSFNKYDKFLSEKKILGVDNKLTKILVDNKLDEISFINLFYFKNFIKDKNIALIANSSDLLKNKNGDLIDSYDIVIRFNSYKIEKKHTGEKTTIHSIIHLDNNENLNHYVPIRFIVSVNTQKWLKRIKKINRFKQGVFVKFNHINQFLGEDDKKIFKTPTTGFVTLITLLSLGGFKKISLFGFNFYESGSQSIYRNKSGMLVPISKVHNYNFEKEFIFKICNEYDEKNNIITLYDNRSF